MRVVPTYIINHSKNILPVDDRRTKINNALIMSCHSIDCKVMY